MFGELMYWIYTGISWIMLRWHDLFSAILPAGTFLGTNWDWILSIVFLVITVRIILFPIFVKQIRSQRAMQALQPKVKELQAKHKGDQQTLREEMMKLYQAEKVNPLMGCLPMFLQIPVFLGLFHVLRRLDPVQIKNTTIYGWTQVEWDSAARARLFNAPIPAHFASDAKELLILGGNGITVKIVAGVLVLIMMATTFMTSRQMILKTGWSVDPQQRMIQRLMLYGIPFSLLLSGWYFPIGVIIYWVTQNIFSFGQQYWVLHKYPPPVTAGNIPMKAAKTTPKAPSGGRGLLARLLPGPDAGTAAAAPTDRPRFFRRRETEAPPTPPTRSALAPRPGAKPVQRRPAPAKAEDAPVTEAASANAAATNGAAASTASTGVTSTDGPTGAAASNGHDGSTPGKAKPATKAKAEAKANGTTPAAPVQVQNGGQPARGATLPASATVPAAAKSVPAGGAKASGSGAAATPAKKAAPRKGPVKKKGGRKR